MKIKFSKAVVLPFLCAVTLSSCDKVKEAIKVNVPVTMHVDLVIPPVTQAGTNLVLQEATTEINIEELIRGSNSSLGADNIRSVNIESVTLTVDENSRFDPDNLTALDYASLAVSSSAKTEPIKIAEIFSSTDPYVMNLPAISSSDLTVYFNAKSFTYYFQVVANRSTTHEIHARAQIKFKIEAGL